MEFVNSQKEHPEMNKLEKYLKVNGFDYSRNRTRLGWSDWDQILVFNDDREVWDAVCHEYSYGYSEGLIEIMDRSIKYGLLTEDEREIDDVLGYLTADEIIERIERKRMSLRGKHNPYNET